VTPAAAQSTAIGRTLNRLAVFDGHLYPAYGDPNANTGPIAAVSLDLAAQTLGSTELTLHTEQTWTMRMLGGRLFVPYVDPQGSFDASQGQYAVATAHGAWSAVTAVTPVPEHVFDVAETVDGLFLFGASGGTNGTIWRSTDSGSTWAQSLSVPGSGLARFYAVAQFGDTMLAQFYDNATNTPLSYRWTGTGWALADNPAQVTDVPCVFSLNGTDFALGLPFAKNLGLVEATAVVVILRPADAAQAEDVASSLPANQISDATTDGTYLYLLTSTLDVLRGDTSGVWSALCTLTDATVRSIAVAGGWLYFGTTDSRILRTPIPA
jgi:hypothetical protein